MTGVFRLGTFRAGELFSLPLLKCGVSLFPKTFLLSACLSASKCLFTFSSKLVHSIKDIRRRQIFNLTDITCTNYTPEGSLLHESRTPSFPSKSFDLLFVWETLVTSPLFVYFTNCWILPSVLQRDTRKLFFS